MDKKTLIGCNVQIEVLRMESMFKGRYYYERDQIKGNTFSIVDYDTKAHVTPFLKYELLRLYIDGMGAAYNMIHKKEI